jgi:pantoate--beta-alanine ligase
MTACLLALGSNLGNRIEQLTAALTDLRDHPNVEVRQISSFFETIPIGGPAGQKNYFNAAATIETELSPDELIKVLLDIEQKLGRQRAERWGPRGIDLDLLLYGDTVLDSPELTLPHPRMQERRFVLAPAAEIAPGWQHPIHRKTISDLLNDLPVENGPELGLRLITSPRAVQQVVLNLRRQQKRIAIVPTMGALHEGHLSLVRIARERADVLVATIFVNPTQFGPSEDLAKYPRALDADLQSLSDAGCHIVFAPATNDMYPPGFSTYIEPPKVAEPFEGKCRPGHFRGVATIVLKLFELIPADIACFGEKDFQQLLVIRRMVEDLSVPIEIVSCPTMREPDGLAMSSRNRYLSPAEREQALALSRALARAEALVASGERQTATIEAAMRAVLKDAGIHRIDYTAIADADTLAQQSTIGGVAVALIGAFVGTTRLIDNRLIGAK